MLDACKQEREELVAFFMLLSLLELYINCCWKKKKKNFPSVFCLPLYCSKTSPSRPVTPRHQSPPLLILSSQVLTPHCTQVPAELLQQGGTGAKICESYCRLLVTIFTSPLTTHWFVLLSFPSYLLALLLPSLLRLILKAQHSLAACTEGRSDGARKKRGGAWLLVRHRKKLPPPPLPTYPIDDKEGFYWVAPQPMSEQCREIQQENCTGSDACADFSVWEQC